MKRILVLFITFFLILFSIGVALGSLACEKMMKEAIHTTYIPLCALAIGVCFYALYALTGDYPHFERTAGLKDFFFLMTSFLALLR